MVAPAFGFSVGDFIAIIELINKAAKALRESTGATNQYQQAVVELDLLQDILRRVQRLQSNAENAATIQKIHFAAHACYVPLAEFLASIQKFESQLGFKASQDASLSKHVIRGGRKIQWAVALESELERLKAKIGPLLSLINVLLHTEGLEELSRLQCIAKEDIDLGRRTLAQLGHLESYVTRELGTRSQMAALLPAIDRLSLEQNKAQEESTRVIEASTDAIQSRLERQEVLIGALLDGLSAPQTKANSVNVKTDAPAGDTNVDGLGPILNLSEDNSIDLSIKDILAALREGIAGVLLMLMYLAPAFQRLLRALTAMPRGPILLLEDNIRLEDALGRIMSLPYEHFKFWPVLQARLQCEFEGKPGMGKVMQNQFHIINLSGGGNRVFTRKTWDRSVFPGAQLAMSMLFRDCTFTRQACPRCTSPTEGADGQRWVECQTCCLTFRILETQRSSGNGNNVLTQPVTDIMAGVEFITDIDLAEEDPSDRLTDKWGLNDIEYFRRIHIIGDQATQGTENMSAQSDGGFTMNTPEIFVSHHSRLPRYPSLMAIPSVHDAVPPPLPPPRHIPDLGAGQDPGWQWAGRFSESRPTDSYEATGDYHAHMGQQKLGRADDDRQSDTSDQDQERRGRESGIRWASLENQPRDRETGVSDAPPIKSILRRPTQNFPEDPNPIREGVAPLSAADSIPPGARWTKIDRMLVNPEALEEAKERFEERTDCVIVLRVLAKEEIQRLADRTKAIRDERYHRERAERRAERLGEQPRFHLRLESAPGSSTDEAFRDSEDDGGDRDRTNEREAS